MINHSEERISSRKGRPLEAWLGGDLHFAFANMVKAYIQEDGLLLNPTSCLYPTTHNTKQYEITRYQLENT